MNSATSPRPGDWYVDLPAMAFDCASELMFFATLEGQNDVRLIAETIADRVTDSEVCPILPDYPVYYTRHLPSFMIPGQPLFDGPSAVWFLEYCSGPLMDAPHDWPRLLLAETLELKDFAAELDATEQWMASHSIVAGIAKGNMLLRLRR